MRRPEQRVLYVFKTEKDGNLFFQGSLTLLVLVVLLLFGWTAFHPFLGHYFYGMLTSFTVVTYISTLVICKESRPRSVMHTTTMVLATFLFISGVGTTRVFSTSEFSLGSCLQLIATYFIAGMGILLAGMFCFDD
mmetsp:Transcript_43813/g.103061  ORF Transcript_43813/g.103061 Transcript_43813/m.103061 type:complete len:135 (+) Transcript_43813:15-419(+)